ncbi:MAG: sterol desaturase family protein [Sphingomonas sp.]|jgi:sterol desaturase/sphingolipid hydroxylase (fatty acid hydroxylase superfamily)|uniref:sterol desaturase family protein n=1 Tax=Sphingomonas sp. TaxID=28214 RepID=UPI003569004B
METLITGSPIILIVGLAMVLTEIVWRVRAGRGYDRGTAMTTMGLVAGNIPAAALNAAVLGVAYSVAWKIAPLHFPLGDWRTWAVGFLLVEFAYYWFHRASHRVRWMWATHAVHHSAEEMTLLSSLRLGWTNVLSCGWLFYVPLILAGFDPRLIVVLLTANLRYQFFLHTEARLSFGPLEWLLNTPSHHRAHHGRNEAYLDCNYGGVLIVFDRLFGTFRPERADEPVEFGLKGRAAEGNPVKVVWREWADLFTAMRKARSPFTAIRVALAPPGVDPDTGNARLSGTSVTLAPSHTTQ